MFDTGPSEKSSSPACIRVARVDFVTSYVTLTFVYCMLYDLYMAFCCEAIFVRNNVLLTFPMFKLKQDLQMKSPIKFDFLV